MVCIDSALWRTAFWKRPGSVRGMECRVPVSPFTPRPGHSRETPSQVPGGIRVSTLRGAVVSLENSAAVRGIEQGLYIEAQIDLKNTALRGKIKQQSEIYSPIPFV